MTTLKAAIEDLLNNRRLTAAEAADRHFSSDFRQRTNGTWDDRATFLARIDHIRDVVAHATVTVLDELGDADRYAERHVIDLLQRDGGRIRQEVYVFATRDPDGRFARLEETTLVLEHQKMPEAT
ncbi:nuclear transport factor 2 family protein [Rhodanobacter caeni]|uniref:SnoaL-like domain-containing protein n=1 Tax=Rhodanobacter caeni TaxID=657654 RepID=A0ABN0U9J4_9GAMM